MIPIAPNNLAAFIIPRDKPTDCFFTLDCGCNWCPGWVAADVTLPLANHSNAFCLVFDATGVTHWLAANRVKYRGECHQFAFAYYQNFNWQKWQEFPKVDNSFIPRAENVFKSSDSLGIAEYLDF